MKESDLGEDLDIYVKNHKEIIKTIEEIKEFETKYQEYDLSEHSSKEELIEIDDQLEEFIETIPKEEKSKTKRKIKFRKSTAEPIVKREIKPTIFHFKLNSENKLENLDFKKPQIKPKKQRSFKLRKKKKDKDELEDKKDKRSKILKFKSGFSKLKKAIPSRKKETEETSESED